MAMTSLAVAADTWVQASVGEADKVTIGSIGAAALIVFVGAAEPNGTSRLGLNVPRASDRELPIGAEEQVWVRSAIVGVATIALVMPHPAIG